MQKLEFVVAFEPLNNITKNDVPKFEMRHRAYYFPGARGAGMRLETAYENGVRDLLSDVMLVILRSGAQNEDIGVVLPPADQPYVVKTLDAFTGSCGSQVYYLNEPELATMRPIK